MKTFGDRTFVSASAALALITMLSVAAAPGHLPPGSQTASPQDMVLQHEVGVSLKLIQVYVTARGGKPVEDLSVEDFEITDNGKPQKVIHFERHFLKADEAPVELPVALPTNRKFFLIFDFAFMDARGVIRSKDAALKFLDTEMRPTDEIGLVTYSATRGLVLHEYLTTDHDRIRKIVEGFGMRHHAGRAENLTDFMYASYLAEMESEGEVGAEMAEEEAQFFDSQARQQTRHSIDEGRRQSYVDQARRYITALGQLAKVFRMIPGFKNVVLFSGGIARQLIYGKMGGASVQEWTTPEQLGQQMSAYDAAQADAGLRSGFTEMLKEFKASNSPVFAVDVSRTMRESDVGSLETIGPGIREIEGSDSLKQFASGTGGKFYANTVDPVRVATDIQAATGAYYVLGYYVDDKWDGKFHRIRVRVKRRGTSVVAQGGYFNPKPFKDHTAFEKLLHVVDLGLSDTPQVQIPYEIPVSGMPVLIKGWPQLLVFGQASLAVHTDVLGKRSEAYLLLFDEKGDMAYIKRFRLDIPETGKETLFPSFLMQVKPGSYTCRLVLRNMDTGRGARGMVPLVIPAEQSAGPSLDPPLLLVPAKDSLDLAASPEGSLGDLYGYDANAYAPLMGDIPPGTGRLYAALRMSGFSMASDIDLAATLTDDATSATTEASVTILKQAVDARTRLFFIEIAPGELASGRYSVEFTARDQKTGAVAAASSGLTVK